MPAPRGRAGGQGDRTLPLNTTSPVGPLGPYAPAPSAPRPPYAGTIPNPINISDPSLPNTFAVTPGPSLGAPLPMPPQGPPEPEAYAVPPQDPLAVTGQRVPAPTVPRLFAPPTGEASATVQRTGGNRAPLWAVAILAATATGIMIGAVLLLVSLFSSPRTSVAQSGASSGAASSHSPTSSTPPSSSASSPTASASPSAPAGSAAGPFFSARAEFLAAIVPQPSSATVPAPSASDTSTAAAAPAPPPRAPVTAADSTEAPAAQPQNQAPPTPVAAQPPAPPTPPQPVAQAPQVVSPAPPPTPVAQPSRHGGPVNSSGGAGGSGLISVICIPGCDQIFDNGKLLGPSPIFKRPATLGSHRIKLVVTNPPASKTISTIVVADQVAMVRESMP
jgi:hypothetical protein